MTIKNIVSNEVVWLLEEMNKLYREGKIKGISIQVMLNDGEFVSGFGGELSYIERLGLLESAKNDAFLSTVE